MKELVEREAVADAALEKCLSSVRRYRSQP